MLMTVNHHLQHLSINIYKFAKEKEKKIYASYNKYKTN